MKALEQVLKSGNILQRKEAILELADLRSERSGRLLLKLLKNNLTHRRGWQEQEFTEDLPGLGHVSGTRFSENHLLVQALSTQKYRKAVPTFNKMLQLPDKWRGIAQSDLLYFIKQISVSSSAPVKTS